MITPKSDHSFAIIICTYNPEERILARVLGAIADLDLEQDTGLECVIVDNNSTLAVSEMDCVKVFLKKCTWAKVITEPEPGKTFALLAGLQATIANNIIIVDDDNELDKNYLKILRKYFDTYSCVAVWGPGRIIVDFTDPVPEWFSNDFRSLFIERNFRHTQYGCALETYPTFFPYGLGMAVKRSILDRYYQEVKKGRLTSVDRKGSCLSCGAGDLQIVWEACKIGLAAGTTPELKMKHLISSRKSNSQYIKELQFGLAATTMQASAESFPSYREELVKLIPSDVAFLCTILRMILSHMLRLKCKRLVVDLAGYLGTVVGLLQATGSNKLRWAHHLVRLFRLKQP